MRTVSLLYAASILSIAGSNAFADDSDVVVVTATRNPQPISTIGSSVSVLTSDDLQRLGVAYVDDALRTLPGVTVTQNGGPGGFSAVRIRGEESYRTVVLLDGIRIDDPAGTQIATNFANLLIGDIGQIEIVRGPQSLLYGADAIGGVVQILTQRPSEGFSYSADISGGAYQTFAGSSALRYGTDKFGAVISAERLETHGFTAKEGDPDLADADGHEALALHGVFRFDPTQAFGVEAVVHYTDADAEFDGASAFPPFSPADPDRVLKTKELDGRLALTNRAFNGRVETELAYAGSRMRRDDFSNGAPFQSFGIPLSRFDGDRDEVSLVSTIALNAAHRLVVGAAHNEVSATTDTAKQGSKVNGVFGEWEFSFAEQLYLTAGLRYDDDGGFGSHKSGRATAAWLTELIAGEAMRIHASYGTGFRAPSPFERAYNIASGFPSLKEEESKGADLGISQSFFARAMSLDVTLFRQIITNEIRFDNLTFDHYFQATGESRSQGVEVSAEAKWPLEYGALEVIEMQAAYTFTDSTVNSPDAEDGLPRLRRPRHASASTLTFHFHEDAQSLAVTVRTSAKSEDGFLNFRVPLDSYAVIDISARAKLTPQAEIYARVTNLLNEQYEEVDGFATSDAAVYVGIRLRGSGT